MQNLLTKFFLLLSAGFYYVIHSVIQSSLYILCKSCYYTIINLPLFLINYSILLISLITLSPVNGFEICLFIPAFMLCSTSS